MGTDNLVQLIYTSAAASDFNPVDLKSILQAARTRNAPRSITGMLLYSSGSFFQVLEGEEAVLSDLFAAIVSDPRHRNVTKIIQEPIAKRAFGDWKMGYAEVDPSDLEAVDGFSDYFRQGNPFVDLQPGRAKKLLGAFAKGRWHARLNGNAK